MYLPMVVVVFIDRVESSSDVWGFHEDGCSGTLVPDTSLESKDWDWDIDAVDEWMMLS